jgi:hypothetical protein
MAEHIDIRYSSRLKREYALSGLFFLLVGVLAAWRTAYFVTVGQLLLGLVFISLAARLHRFPALRLQVAEGFVLVRRPLRRELKFMISEMEITDRGDLRFTGGQRSLLIKRRCVCSEDVESLRRHLASNN